jgi:type II secretory pathway pseudopilin PulG
MKRIHSSSSVFLMEILLNILLFSLMLVIGLQFFLKAHSQTVQTKALHQAVTTCENIAALFQNGDGTLDDLAVNCSHSIQLNGQLQIYLDDDFAFCQKQDASYYITATPDADDGSTLSRLEITCYTQAQEEIFSLTACRYTPLQNTQNNGGSAHLMTANAACPCKEVA